MKPQDIINKQKAVLAIDSERMTRRPKGVCRSSWRCDNPIEYLFIHASDTAFKTKPERVLRFDLNGSATDLWVWSMPRVLGRTPFVVERIDLAASDAQERLDRYELTGYGKALE